MSLAVTRSSTSSRVGGREVERDDHLAFVDTELLGEGRDLLRFCAGGSPEAISLEDNARVFGAGEALVHESLHQVGEGCAFVCRDRGEMIARSSAKRTLGS